MKLNKKLNITERHEESSLKKHSKGKAVLTQTILFLSMFGVSGGATLLYFAQSASAQGDAGVGGDTQEAPKLTDVDVLMASMTSLETFTLNGAMDFTYLDDGQLAKIELDGQGDITNLDFKIAADMNITVNGFNAIGKLGYFNNNIYLDYNDSHIKCEQTNLIDFVNLLPSFGINVGVPDELANLNFDQISNDLAAMTPTDLPDGTRLFELPLNKDIKVFFKATKENKFVGIRTNRFIFKDMQVYADFNVLSQENLVVTNPEELPDAVQYQSFTPALGLIQGMFNFFGQTQNSIDLTVDVKQNVPAAPAPAPQAAIQETTTPTQEIKDLVSVKTNIRYDRSTNDITIGADIHENQRIHKVGIALHDNAVYLNHADLNKVYFTNASAMNTIGILMDEISDETLQKVFDKLGSMMTGVDMTPTLKALQNVNGWVKNIVVNEGKVKIIFDLNALGVKANEVSLTFDGTSENLQGITISRIDINGTLVDIEMKTRTYETQILDTTSYVCLDHSQTLIKDIILLSRKDNFRVNLSADVTNANQAIKPIEVRGGFQFDVKKLYGYGDVTITDQAAPKHPHKIRADYREDQQILMSYNDNLRVKMSSLTITELMQFIGGLMSQDPQDPHFAELFGSVLAGLKNTPLYKGISGDYGLLFATKAFHDITCSETGLSLRINGALMGMDEVDFKIELKWNDEAIESLTISELTMNGQTITLVMSLTTYDKTLDTKRLDPYLEYYDFTNMKDLVEVAYNTTKPNEFHLTGNIEVTLIGIKTILLPLDIRIKNNPADATHSKNYVTVAAWLKSVPILSTINDTKGERVDSRTVSFYFDGTNIYGTRRDTGAERWTGQNIYHDYQFVADQTNFFDTNNILRYAFDFALGLRPFYYDQIVNAILPGNEGGTQGYEIWYENVISSFIYNYYEDYYAIQLSINALTGKTLNDLLLKLHVNQAEKYISGVSIDWAMVTGVSMVGRINLENFGQDVDTSALDNYVLAHKNDQLNVITNSKVQR